MKPPRFDRIRRWWSYRQARKACFHHWFGLDPQTHQPTAQSYIVSELIDLGRRKMFECTHCEKVWIA